MQRKKTHLYIVLLFAVFPACGGHLLEEIYSDPFDPFPPPGTPFDCHPRIRDAYFSTLLQADKHGPCDICEIGAVNRGFITSTSTETVLRKYPVISVFGAKPVISSWTIHWVFLTNSGMIGSRMGIKGPPNPLVMELLVPWESDLKDFWGLARLARWRSRQQIEVDAADDLVRGIDQLNEQTFYIDAVIRFYSSVFLPPEDPAADYYRATAKLALGDTESTLGNVEQAQHLYQTAIQDYTQAISGAPRNINAHVLRSYAKFRLGVLTSAVGNVEQAEHHYHAAIADCSRAMALYREDEGALKAALAVYTEMSEVMRAYPSAIRLRDRYAFAYHLRGLEKQALGEHTAAAADFRKAWVLQLMPSSGGPLAPTLGRRTGEGW